MGRLPTAQTLLLVVALLMTACSAAPSTPAPTATPPVVVSSAIAARAWIIADPALLLGGLAHPDLALLPPIAPDLASYPMGAADAAPTMAAPRATPTNGPVPTAGALIEEALVPAVTVVPAALTPAPTARRRAPQAPPRPTDAELAPWEQPVLQWTALHLDVIADMHLPPTRAARDLAMLEVGFNDGFLAADAAREQGAAVSDDALLAAIALRTLSAVQPLELGRWQRAYHTAVWAGVWRGADSLESVVTGITLGERVAQAVLATMGRDGSDAVQHVNLPSPESPGVWQPTAPDYAYPLDAAWGAVRPIGLESLRGLEAAPPPAWDSAAFQAGRAAWLDTQQRLTDAQRGLAQKWAGDSGTATAVGLWFAIARQLLTEARADTRTTAQVSAALAVTAHNALIACWAGKYQYMVARPITWMRATDPTWAPPLLTPAFPSYPSSHATLSAAAADLLGAYFPNQAAQLQQQAQDAARSQVDGGIHWTLDSDAGLDQGHRVGQAMLAVLSAP